MLENYAAHYEYPLAVAQLVLFMLGMGATLSWRDFQPVFRLPRDLLLGLFLVLIVTPFLALAVAEVTGLSAGLAMGFLLVATLPGGTFSNVYTFLGKGNVALSIALSACGAFVAIVTLPLMLRLLGGSYLPDTFEMPVLAIVIEILLCVILPVLIGMWLARRFPRQQKLVVRWAMRLGLVLVVVMVIGSFASGRIRLQNYSVWDPIKIIAFCVLAQQLCPLPLRLMKWPSEDYVAIAMEITVRNAYLGLLITTTLAHAGLPPAMVSDVLFVVLFYGGAMLFVGFPMAMRVRRAIRRRNRQQSASPDSDPSPDPLAA